MKEIVAVTLWLAATFAFGAPVPKTSCADLLHLSLPDTTITSAEVAGESCRVAATVRPTSDSEIRIAVWLPVAGWNGKFLAVGSGGWGGETDDKALQFGLHRGYATAATDDGHEGRGGAFVLGHPEKFVDFAYRSEHEMTVKAKAIIRAFYGVDPRYSYWDGCSGGGREGLLQAYRFPGEFDGVIAGDPATFRRNAWALWLAQNSFKDPADYIPPSKYPMIHQAVLDACDSLDGLKDGLIDDPTRCQFDPKVLQCKHGDEATCLTARQVQTARTILSPATTHSGQEIFPRLEPGTELRWGRLAGGPEPADLFLDYFKYVVHKNPNWDWRSFDLESDAALGNAMDKDVIALDPDLARFASHGGKLLLYHGWADQQVAPEATVEFYKAAVGGDEKQSWVRLFMAPGMAHCGGGEGPNAFDELSPMEQWVEKGQAPTQIVAAHSLGGKVDRTRPLCPYPQVARYQGKGSINDAANFACK